MAGIRLPGLAVGFALLAALVVAPVAAIARDHGFDGLYGQDAFAYSDYAMGPLRATLLAVHAPPWFALPPGYPLLVALVSLVAGPGDGVGQAVSLVAGASIPALVGLLVLELRSQRDDRMPVALLAGLVAAVAGQLWQSSLVAMSDTPAAAAATLGTLATVRFHRTGRGGWLLLGAAALALAIEIRIVHGVVAVVCAGLALARVGVDARADPRAALGLAGLASLVALIVLAPTLGPIATAVAGDRPVPFTAELGVAAFDPLTPFLSTFDTTDGHLRYRLPMAAWYLVLPARPYWLGAVALAVPVGLVAVLRGRLRPADGAVLVAWPALMLLVLVAYPYQNPRFLLGMLPPLAILAAIGIMWGWRTTRARRSARWIAVIAAATAFALQAAFAWQYASDFAGRQAANLAAIRTLEAKIPADARVISLGATPVLRHDGRVVEELFSLTPARVDGLASAGRVYVLVDPVAIEGQWAGTTPGRSFERLRTRWAASRVDARGSWALYVTAP